MRTSVDADKSERGMGEELVQKGRKGKVREKVFFFQAEDGIRDLVRSRGLGDVYKRQGHTLKGYAKNGIIHLINSGAAALDGTGRCEKNGEPIMKPFYEITQEEAQACLDNTTWGPASLGYFRGGGFSSTFLTKGGMPVTMTRMNIVDGLGPVFQIAEGWTVDIDPKAHEKLND